MNNVDLFQKIYGDIFTTRNNERFSQSRSAQSSKNVPYEEEGNFKICKSAKLPNSDVNLVPVTQIPPKYQSVFGAFPYFNKVQSTVFEDALYTDKPLVVCAPTGSGKTVIFELCIVRLLMLMCEPSHTPLKYKIVYMAPIKSLCNERYEDWKKKFQPLGANCIQLTGDTETEDYFELQKYSIILTTPEKWDSMTRLWRNNRSLVLMVKLMLIDEIHLLNEEQRGATMEAALSRMKTIQSVLECESLVKKVSQVPLRFVAVSATFPNAEDAVEWLSTSKLKGISYKLNENLRPVELKKVVIGYPCAENFSEFRFDLMLSYKLANVIHTYSERKPTLVFCSTRKSAIQTACILSGSAKFVLNAQHKHQLIEVANMMHDNKLRECILSGIGIHHAGLEVSDRRLVEQLFLNNSLQVLIATSTLCMGVNFPAHLVIIKSTAQYAAGCYREYSETQILQMIGRAGRPQFDSSATAVIMTKMNHKGKYESLMNGTQLIESSLHKHIVEHLNAEIVLNTISDVSIAMEWLKATYLYVRVFKNPRHYGINMELSTEKIERKLQDLVIKELNGLRKYNLISMDDDSFNLQPTETGKLMARYYLSFETMKNFSSVSSSSSLMDLLILISSCKEFEDIQLRTSEKKFLNDLNKNKMYSIRYPVQGKIKTRVMKINCLTQATFGCIPIPDPSLNQDVAKILRSGVRIAACLSSYLALDVKGFSVLYNAIILAKCFKARLWENSKHVSRQLEKIGITLSTLLVSAGITSFEKIERTNPRELELILKRNPPFGNLLIESSKRLPKYDLEIDQVSFNNSIVTICITILLKNEENLDNRSPQKGGYHLLIGDADDKIVLINKIMNSYLLRAKRWTKNINIPKAQKGADIKVVFISDSYVGLDISRSYTLIYGLENASDTRKKEEQDSVRQCHHKCLSKATCCHECCKSGVKVASATKKTKVENFFQQLQDRVCTLPPQIQARSSAAARKSYGPQQPEESYAKHDDTEISNNAMLDDNIIRQLTPNFEDVWDDAVQMEEGGTETMELCEDSDFEKAAFDIQFDEAYAFDAEYNVKESYPKKINEEENKSGNQHEFGRVGASAFKRSAADSQDSSLPDIWDSDDLPDVFSDVATPYDVGQSSDFTGNRLTLGVIPQSLSTKSLGALDNCDPFVDSAPKSASEYYDSNLSDFTKKNYSSRAAVGRRELAKEQDLNSLNDSEEMKTGEKKSKKYITHFFTQGRDPTNVIDPDDPIATEKCFQMCLDILSSDYR
ncbi:probable ATP-dependent DNA helicase HFM1 [Uloborus diversus]|uniref:probable ATP-dependent DNA helicase HFM1 n=1 Tax=Uloborus diversus TaxID=327109 RepID=UPI0024090561|nr:probable ATP-dependent DNA helicase HFM1 [Uloborus diversus]